MHTGKMGSTKGLCVRLLGQDIVIPGHPKLDHIATGSHLSQLPSHANHPVAKMQDKSVGGSLSVTQ